MTDFDGNIDPAAGWVDVPQLSLQALLRGGTGGVLNAQAVAIVQRLKYLRTALDGFVTPTAGSVAFTPTANIASNTVQNAIAELDADLRAIITGVEDAFGAEIDALAASTTASLATKLNQTQVEALINAFVFVANDFQFQDSKRLLARNSAGSGIGEEVSLTQLLDWIGGASAGDMLYRGTSAWQRLPKGTDGQGLIISSGLPVWGDVERVIKISPVAAANQAAIDFNDIPSWVKEITVMFSGLSTTGSSNIIVQVGSGSVMTTSYLGSTAFTGGGSAGTAFTTGFGISSGLAASSIIHGVASIATLGGGVWAFGFNGAFSSTAAGLNGGGSVTLPGVLDRIRVTTVNGTDTFDAGSIAILARG